MQETDRSAARWLRATPTLSAKLNILLLSAMVVIFALLGYLNVRLHRQHLEQNTLLSAERMSDIIKQGTTDYMTNHSRRSSSEIAFSTCRWCSTFSLFPADVR